MQEVITVLILIAATFYIVLAYLLMILTICAAILYFTKLRKLTPNSGMELPELTRKWLPQGEHDV